MSSPFRSKELYKASCDQNNTEINVINDAITVPEFSFRTDVLTATPLDPYNVEDKDGEYFLAASNYMLDKLDDTLRYIEKGSIASFYHDFFRQLINDDHAYRANRNSKSMDRLRAALIDTEIYEGLKPLILDLRAGTASVEDALVLMSIIPEVGAIEVMKQTAPFDMDAFRRAHLESDANIKRACNVLGFRFEETDDFDCPLKTKELIQHGDIKAVIRKRPELRIDANGVQLELIRSQIEVIYDVGIPSVPEHIVNVKGELKNVQPMIIAKYIRLAQTPAA